MRAILGHVQIRSTAALGPIRAHQDPRVCGNYAMLGLPREIYCSEQKHTQPAVKKARAEKQAGAAAAAVVSMESDATDATESGNE